MGQFGIGQPVRRLEDQRFLTGTGRYADDVVKDGLVFAAFVRSPVAHARVVAVASNAARSAPGVIKIYTGADWTGRGFGPIPIRTQLTNVDGSELVVPDRWPLATEKVRHVGDPVAMVIATSRHAAEDAAELIDVTYEDLDVAATVEAAAADGAPRIHDDRPGNIVMDWQCGDATKAATGLADAAHVITCDLINNRVIPNSMEPRGVVASPGEDGGYELTGSIQNVFVYRDLITQTLNWDKADLRVFADDIGGGFGCKNQVQPEHFMVVLAASDLNLPVKWICGRSQGFLSDAHARALTTRVKLGLDADYRFTGLQIATRADIGAYCSTNGPMIPTTPTAAVLGGAYYIQNIYMRVTGYYTNTVPTDAYRGAGRPEATYLLERTIDKAARELGIDPMEIRARNLIPREAIPYTTALGRTFDSGDFPKVLDLCMAQSDRAGFAARQQASLANGYLRGWGMAFYLESTLGVPTEFASVTLQKDGAIEMRVGTQNAGMGHETSFSQLISEVLDVPLDKITYRHADTAGTPQGGGHGGSRSIQIGGSAVYLSANKVLDRLKALAGDLLEAAVEDVDYRDGAFRIVGTDQSVSFEAVLQSAPDAIAESHIYERENNTFPNGCHAIEVEVDPQTGSVSVEKVTVVDDFGTIVNPMIVHGQIMGGIAQGIGQALLEHTLYDAESGQLLSGSFMDYTMPRADNFPPFDITFFEDEPAKTNPMGVKGCGEAGTIGAMPAVVNAVVDALAGYGVTHLDMPLLEETIFAVTGGERPATR